MSFRDRIRNNEPLLGMIVQFRDPAVVEIVGRAGFDFTILDLEHSAMSIAELPNLVRAADVAGIPALVRLPIERIDEAGRALDAGAVGIHVANVRTVAEVEAVVAASRYPPDGERGACPVLRTDDYGFTLWPDHVARSAAETVVGVAVEGPEALGNIDEILAVAGLDYLFVGVFDLSTRLGHPGDPTHPEVAAALADVSDQARAAGVAMATWATDLEVAARWRDAGVSLISVSTDAMTFREACLRLTGRGSVVD